MDLHTIESVLRPGDRGELPPFRDGDAFLGGGTWLFSEPQTRLRRLIDLTTLGWPSLRTASEGLHVGATCTIAELEEQVWPAAWVAAPIVRQCCRSLLGSFKIRNVATVGGNICLALPAAPMVALATALDGVCLLWAPDGGERRMGVTDFVLGPQQNALGPGEMLRSVLLNDAAFRRRCALRQVSLTTLGRSAALLIGSLAADGFALTITASTRRPVRLDFLAPPAPAALAARIDAAVPTWHDDVHGRPDWRRHVTHLAAQEILAELAPL